MGSAAVKSEPGTREAALVDLLGDRAIVVVGMPGAGKSAVGKRLAARLGLRFRDADIEIEAAAQKTIPEIFESDGEAFFRDKERRIILRLLRDESPLVLATGGGAFMNPDTREGIRQHGISVWLKADLDVLMRRVRRKANRPLLKTADPEGALRSLLEARLPIYAQADLAVASREVAHEIVLEEVLAAIEAHLAGAPR